MSLSLPPNADDRAEKSPNSSPARVAVVVTCFNSGATLVDTIASINSCGTAVELVVVDDGSTDEHTHQVLSDLQEAGVLIIRQRNLGQAAATAAGVAATRAPYVMRFDSDDLLEAGAVDDLADALDNAGDIAVAWGSFQTFGLTTFVVPGAPALDPWLLTYVNLLPGSGALIRRSALVSVGGWQLSDGFEDWDLWMSFAERGFVGISVPRIVFRYRRHHASRQAQAHHLTPGHYQSLLSRHPRLHQNRRQNLLRSDAPIALKFLVPLVEALPMTPRVTKINSCEFLARAIWGRAPGRALEMLWQGVALRGRAILRRK